MKKISVLKRKKRTETPSRITNETVAEHRERVLAGGRRFKYPIQYTKNRLVINVLIIGFAVLAAFLVFSWWQLYKVQTTDEFFYRIVRIVPLPVAKVEDQFVKYGDYLLSYKISETYLNTVEKADQTSYANGGNKNSIYDFYKAQAMRNAVADTYAQKLAREKGVSITEKDVDTAIKNLLQATDGRSQISKSTYDRANEQLYGLSASENRYYLKERLLRQAVAYRVDSQALEAAKKMEETLKHHADTPLEKLSKDAEATGVKAQVAMSGWVSKENKDGGLAIAAAKLTKGKTSGIIKPLTGDGYYFVRLLDTNKDGEINYQFIKIPLTVFKKQVDALFTTGKVKYYIVVPESKTQLQPAKQ